MWTMEFRWTHTTFYIKGMLVQVLVGKDDFNLN